MEAVFREDIQIDGQDSTSKIIDMVEGANQKEHIKAVILDGITFGGFNPADIEEIKEKTGKIVIAVNRNRPDFEKIKKAAEQRENEEKIVEAVENAGKVYKKEMERGKIYFQYTGTDREKAEEIIENCINEAETPEPVRTAHLIASGVKTGKSTGGR